MEQMVPTEGQRFYNKRINSINMPAGAISVLSPNPPPHDNGISGTVKDRYGFTWVLSAQTRP
jgi:hypothetical protein